LSSVDSADGSKLVRPGLLALLVAVLGALVFAPSLGGDFIYDDREIILQNPYVHSLAWVTRWFSSDFLDSGAENALFIARLGYYRPLVTASYAVDWVLGHGSPVLFHVSNLVVHAVVSGLVFTTLRRWLGTTWPAFVAALVIAVHPTKAESVAWISGRTDVYCALFILIACMGMWRRLAGKRGGIALEVVGTLGAYLCKETAIVLPAFVLLEAWAYAGRPAFERETLKRLIRPALPQIALAVLYLAVRSAVLPVSGNLGIDAAFTTPLARVLTVLESFGRTAQILVLPHPLMVQQGLFEFDDHGNATFSTAYVLLGGLSLVLLIGGMIWTRRRSPRVCAGLGLFLVCLLPVSHVLPTRMLTFISERFLYLPSLGLGMVLLAWLDRSKLRIWAASTCGVATLAFGALSIERSFDYSDERAFWGHEVRVNPRSAQARRKLIEFATEDRRFDDALAEFVRVHEIASARSPYRELAADSIVEAVDLLAFLTPDRQREKLLTIERFCDEAGERQRATLSFVRGSLKAEIQVKGGLVGQRIRVLRPKLRATRAEVLFRLGDEHAARGEAEQVLASCPGCSELGRRAALVLARTGDFSRAERVLRDLTRLLRGGDRLETALRSVREAKRLMTAADRGQGPGAIFARAMAYTTLGAYGRAYDVLSPHEAELSEAADAALGYAKIAWLAGYPETARRTLARHLSSEQIRTLTASWPNWLTP
jgi:protein O-mannosyl-transferase